MGVRLAYVFEVSKRLSIVLFFPENIERFQHKLFDSCGMATICRNLGAKNLRYEKAASIFLARLTRSRS